MTQVEKNSPLSPFLLSYTVNIRDCFLEQEFRKKLQQALGLKEHPGTRTGYFMREPGKLNETIKNY